MSVTTTADEAIHRATDHLESAYKDLLAVVNPDTWGHSDFKKEYIDDIFEAISLIMNAKRKL